MSNGVDQLDQSVQPLPSQTQSLATGSAQVSSAVGGAAAAVDSAYQQAASVVATICETPGPLCSRATAALAQLQQADNAVGSLASGANSVAVGNAQLAAGMPALVNGLDDSASGAQGVADGANSAADSGASLASGADGVAGGAESSKVGGASVADGAQGVADGAESAQDGGASLADGAESLSSGAAQVDSGAQQLADGLGEAVGEIPTYTSADITTISAVVATPVITDSQLPAEGSKSVPLIAALALWIGAMTVALAHSAVARSRLLTSRSSVSLAFESTGPVAAIGAAQGLAVGLALLSFVDVQAPMLAYLGASTVVGMVFAVINTGLAALFGGFGRMLGAVVASVLLAVGIVSTAPSGLDTFASLMPTAPAGTLLRAGIGIGSGWAALIGFLLWGVVGFVLVLAGTGLRRHGDGLLAGETD